MQGQNPLDEWDIFWVDQPLYLPSQYTITILILQVSVYGAKALYTLQLWKKYKVIKMKRTEQINALMDAVKHYQKTGKHKQVSIRYNPENRTQFEFNSWNFKPAGSTNKRYSENPISVTDLSKNHLTITSWDLGSRFL